MTQSKSKKFWVGSNVRSCPLSSWKSIGFFSRTGERILVSSLQLSYLKHASAWLTLRHWVLVGASSHCSLWQHTASLLVPTFCASGCTPSHQLCGGGQGSVVVMMVLSSFPIRAHLGFPYILNECLDSSHSGVGDWVAQKHTGPSILGCSEAHWPFNTGHLHRVRLQSYSK